MKYLDRVFSRYQIMKQNQRLWYFKLHWGTFEFCKKPVRCLGTMSKIIRGDCLFKHGSVNNEWQKVYFLPRRQKLCRTTHMYIHMGILVCTRYALGEIPLPTFLYTNYIKKRSICLMWRLYDLFEVFFMLMLICWEAIPTKNYLPCFKFYAWMNDEMFQM